MWKLTFAVLAVLALTRPVVAQERQWTLDTSDQDVFLVFGVPESDDVGISIWCTIQSGKSKIYVPEAGEALRPGHHAPLRLSAGKVTVRLRGTVTENLEAGTNSIEAELATVSPLYSAMQTADRLKVLVAGKETVYPLADADIEGLLKLCNKP